MPETGGVARAVPYFDETLIDVHGEGRDGHGVARHFVPSAVTRLGGTASFATMATDAAVRIFMEASP